MSEKPEEVKFYFLTALLVTIAVLAFFLSGCSIKQPETVLTKTCYLADLEPSPELPAVSFEKENCEHFRCITKSQAVKLREREIRLRADNEYVRSVYLDAQVRCNK